MAGETWQTEDTRALFETILDLGGVAEAERFFRDLCTMGELHDMAQRWAVARMLDEGLHYADISRRTGASTATITRIASWLNHGEGGYRAALDRMSKARRRGGKGGAKAASKASSKAAMGRAAS
jgi:TrpR-related protein YerC/YecD